MSALLSTNPPYHKHSLMLALFSTLIKPQVKRLMSAFRAGLLGLGSRGIWGTKTAQFDLSVACERPVWAGRWVTKPDYIEALCLNPMRPIRICQRWAYLGSNRPNFYKLFDVEKDRTRKIIFFVKKSATRQKMAQKHPCTPIFPAGMCCK